MHTNLSFDELNKRHQQHKATSPSNIDLRIHRALSWLDRANRCSDSDGRFIFLWVAFNAAYANQIHDLDNFSEASVFHNFIGQLVRLDGDKLLYEAIWSEFSSSIRLLLKNEYIFRPFWEFQSDRISKSEWRQKFTAANVAANHALANNDTTKLLFIVCGRMYFLRNQLIHGGATWNSSVNRDQVQDCAKFLGKIVPITILILMDNPNKTWGEPIYPVVT